MPITTRIECDRCGDDVDSGTIIGVDRVVMGYDGYEHNVNMFGDQPTYALCVKCGNAVRAFIKGDR